MIWGQLQEESETRVQWFVCSVEMWKTEVRIFLPTDIYLYKTGKLQSVCLNITEFSLWPVLSRIPHGPDVQRRRHSETISLPSLWYHVALCVCILFIHLFKFIYFLWEKALPPVTVPTHHYSWQHCQWPEVYMSPIIQTQVSHCLTPSFSTTHLFLVTFLSPTVCFYKFLYFYVATENNYWKKYIHYSK